MVLLNDWSARDIQNGICTTRSILAKNFTIYFPWIVTMDALEPFRTKGQNKNLLHFPTLKRKTFFFDINLEAIQPENAKPTVVSHSILNIYIGLCASNYTILLMDAE
jgi:fumarylacetoacetase